MTNRRDMWVGVGNGIVSLPIVSSRKTLSRIRMRIKDIHCLQDDYGGPETVVKTRKGRRYRVPEYCMYLALWLGWQKLLTLGSCAPNARLTYRALALTLAVIGYGMSPTPADDRRCYRVNECDSLEVNHFYNETAELIFTQLIGWNVEKGKEHCDWWKMKPVMQSSGRRHWVSDDVMGVVRIDAASFRVVHSQEDRELVDREHKPKDRRAGIRGMWR